MNGDIWILLFEAGNVLDRQQKGQSIEVQLTRVVCVILNAIAVISSRREGFVSLKVVWLYFVSGTSVRNYVTNRV